MSEFKGTKAPWEARISQLGIDVIQQGTGFGIIDFGTNEDLRKADYSFEVAEANAKLISKAPEMLEMLKKLTSLLNDIDSTLFHHNHSVNGWHLNGDSEPIMNFVAEMDMECLSAAEQLIKEATEL